MNHKVFGWDWFDQKVHVASCEGQGLGGGLWQLDVVSCRNGACYLVNCGLYCFVLKNSKSAILKNTHTNMQV